MTITISFNWMRPFAEPWRKLGNVVHKEWLRFLIRTSLPNSPYRHEYEGRLAKAKSRP